MSAPLRVAMVNTFDRRGGAALSALRLHRALLEREVETELWVQHQDGNDASVRAPVDSISRLLAHSAPRLDRLSVKAYPPRPGRIFSPALAPDTVPDRVSRQRPDLVHLHWVNQGFLSVESVARFGLPVVWTLHDMWAFTGGCHYDEECGRFRQACGRCPQLLSDEDDDLSRSVFERKARHWAGVPLTLVSPSRWLAAKARESTLFRRHRIEVISNGLDLQMFKPLDRREARRRWKLPEGGTVLLFGAMSSISDTRKGWHLLEPALKALAAQSQRGDTRAVIFGDSGPTAGPDLGMPVTCLGPIEDQGRLSELYAAADVFIAPSVQENLANTVIESLACGTPVVAFSIGGMPDLIDHQQTGYLARPFDVEGLTEAIRWTTGPAARRTELSRRSRERAERLYSIHLSAERYLGLYRSVLGREQGADSGAFSSQRR